MYVNESHCSLHQVFRCNSISRIECIKIHFCSRIEPTFFSSMYVLVRWKKIDDRTGREGKAMEGKTWWRKGFSKDETGAGTSIQVMMGGSWSS